LRLAGGAYVRLLGEELLVLPEVEEAPSRQVDHGGRNGPARCPVVHHQRCHGRRQSVRRGRHENGVVVDVYGVAAVRIPAEEHEDDEEDGQDRDTETNQRIQDTGPTQLGGVLGRGGRVNV
jgi:hypothetical protein